MSVNDINTDARDIRMEACTWMAQLETGDMKAADVDAFREWVRRSPRHAREIQRLAALSSSLNVLTDMAGPMQEAARQRRDAVSSATSTRWRRPLALAAGVAAIFVLATSLYITQAGPGDRAPWSGEWVTAVGEYREEVLPDGSTIDLNTDSRVQVVYTEQGREVKLDQGEALFTVAHDPDRPFTVTAGDRAVTAVGTAFVIRKEVDRFAVTVTEGRVRLQTVATDAGPGTTVTGASVQGATSPASAESVTLQKGERFVQADDGTGQGGGIPVLETVSAADLRRELAWKEGFLGFTNTELGQVIREVSRHTTLKIEIPDPDLRSLRFGGVFRTGDTKPLFDALEAAFDIRAVYITENTVMLTRAES